MDEQTYLEFGEAISQLTETCLERRFGNIRRDVPPTHETDDSSPLSERILKE